MDNNRQTNFKKRAGVTIIELLIVMGVIVILAAVSLPTLKGLLADQKVSQAARLVQNYAEGARARAIATGRPVALILDRMVTTGANGDANSLIGKNACIRLSTGDVFPPYSGDWAGSQGDLVDTSGDGYADAIRISTSQAASLLDTSVSPPASSGLVNSGDLIQFGARRELFVISGSPFLETSTGTVQINIINPPLFAANLPMQEPSLGVGGGAATVSFKIFRRPSKSISPGLSLPRGTCIDMHFSGLGPSGRQFSSDTIQDTAGTTVDYPATSTSGNPDYGPIYLVFNANGTLTSWYYQNRAASVSSPTLFPAEPTGLVHLLIGATDQIPESPFLSSGPALISTEDYKTNIMDTLNSWVTINPYTGSIYSSPLQSTEVVATGADPVSIRVSQARSLATNGFSQANN